MEELQISIDVLEDISQRLTNEVDELNNFGNTPDENYTKMLELLTEWNQTQKAIKELKRVKEAVISNNNTN